MPNEDNLNAVFLRLGRELMRAVMEVSGTPASPGSASPTRSEFVDLTGLSGIGPPQVPQQPGQAPVAPLATPPQQAPVEPPAPTSPVHPFVVPPLQMPAGTQPMVPPDFPAQATAAQPMAPPPMQVPQQAPPPETPPPTPPTPTDFLPLPDPRADVHTFDAAGHFTSRDPHGQDQNAQAMLTETKAWDPTYQEQIEVAHSHGQTERDFRAETKDALERTWQDASNDYRRLNEMSWAHEQSRETITDVNI